MSTSSYRHSPATGTRRKRRGARGSQPTPRRRTPLASENPTAIPAMGPANRAPGPPIMGRPSWNGYPDLMGRPDARPGVRIMGVGDQGGRAELFGRSDHRFVDSLFTPLGSQRRRPS
jgi:hypothetical protein